MEEVNEFDKDYGDVVEGTWVEDTENNSSTTEETAENTTQEPLVIFIDLSKNNQEHTPKTDNTAENLPRNYEEGLRAGRELTREEYWILRNAFTRTIDGYTQAVNEYRETGLPERYVTTLIWKHYGEQIEAFNNAINNEKKKAHSSKCSPEQIRILTEAEARKRGTKRRENQKTTEEKESWTAEVNQQARRTSVENRQSTEQHTTTQAEQQLQEEMKERARGRDVAKLALWSVFSAAPLMVVAGMSLAAVLPVKVYEVIRRDNARKCEEELARIRNEQEPASQARRAELTESLARIRKHIEVAEKLKSFFKDGWSGKLFDNVRDNIYAQRRQSRENPETRRTSNTTTPVEQE